MVERIRKEEERERGERERVQRRTHPSFLSPLPSRPQHVRLLARAHGRPPRRPGARRPAHEQQRHGRDPHRRRVDVSRHWRRHRPLPPGRPHPHGRHGPGDRAHRAAVAAALLVAGAHAVQVWVPVGGRIRGSRRRLRQSFDPAGDLCGGFAVHGWGPRLYARPQKVSAGEDGGVCVQAARQRPKIRADPRPRHPRAQRVRAVRQRDGGRGVCAGPDGRAVRRATLAGGVPLARLYAPWRRKVVAGPVGEHGGGRRGAGWYGRERERGGGGERGATHLSSPLHTRSLPSLL